MDVLTTKTKKGQNLLARARSNYGEDLSDVYGRYSSAKADAMKDCKKMSEEEDGDDFRIISFNTNFFSVAWDFIYDGKPAVHIITPANDYVVVREEVEE